MQGLLNTLAEEDADVRLVARLEAIRLRQADVKDDRFVLARSRVEYQHAFRTYGLLVDATSPEHAAAVLRRRPPSVGSTLLAALDHWLILARFEKAPEVELVEAGACRGGHGPLAARRSGRTREKRSPGDGKAGAEVDTAAQPPEALFVLEMGLDQRGASGAALALLRRAQQAFPGDFWINHDLGLALLNCQQPQYEEAIRFLTAALALRPESPGVRLNLGIALASTGRLDEAQGAYRQAIALKPDYSMAHLRLGLVLGEKGHLDEAVAACRRAGELKPDYATPTTALAFSLRKRGDSTRHWRPTARPSN